MPARLLRTVKVSEKGQVALPADLRRALRIEKGTTLVLVTDGRRIYMEKEEDAARSVVDDFGPFLAASERVLAELWENDEDTVWDDV